jgi:hypothetical protein
MKDIHSAGGDFTKTVEKLLKYRGGGNQDHTA